MTMPALAFDARHKSRRGSWGERGAFARARRADVQYAMALRKVARQIGELVRSSGVVVDGKIMPDGLSRLRKIIAEYTKFLTPWAENTAMVMLSDVSRRDERAWRTHAQTMGRSLREELQSVRLQPALARLHAEQVALITSLPIEAIERVNNLTTEALFNSMRAADIAKEITRSGEVVMNRANLIARTEVGRAASTLTQARAEHIGSVGYIWRTAHDADVRKTHRKLDGTFHAWNDPPIAGEKGERYHAGAGPNCRCYAEPVIPSVI